MHENYQFYALPILLASFFLTNHAQAFVAFTATVEDINSAPSIYNYKISPTCIGNCSDTVQGSPATSLWNNADDFYVPYFPDAGISNIGSPLGWSANIEASNDIFNLGNNAGAIHWFASNASQLPLYDSLSGFTYSSTLSGSVKAPFRIDYGSNGNYLIGDPPIPASPLAIAAGLPVISDVPVPASLWLFASALIGLFGLNRKPVSV